MRNAPTCDPRSCGQAVPLYPNYVYNSAQVNRAYTDLMSLGYFKSAKIEFVEQPQSAEVTNYVSFIGASADSTQTRYTREGYLKCNILCTPTLKQSFKVDLEGSTTSSFYGLKATVGYQNRNIFRGAEAFDVSFTAGYEFMKAPDARKKRATEFGITTGLTFPRFLMPWRTRRFRSVNQPKTKVELSVNFQDRPYYRRTLSSAGITYQWTNNRYSTFSLRPIDINVVDVNNLDESFLMINKTDSAGQQELTPNKYLLESFRTQFIGGLTFGYSYNNQRKNLGGNATNIRFNFETAGNLIDAVDRLFYARPKDGSPAKIFGIEYSQYFRTRLSISPQDHAGGSHGARRPHLWRRGDGLRQFDLRPVRPPVLLRRQQRYARLGAPYAGTGFGARPPQFLPHTDGRCEAGGQHRTAIPDMGHGAWRDLLRPG